MHDLLTSFRKAIVWGYGHYFVFASAAAVGAGLAVAVDQATHHAEISAVARRRGRRDTGRGLSGLPVVSARPARVPADALRSARLPPCSCCSRRSPVHGVLLTGGILASLIAIKLVLRRQVS